MLSHKQIRPNPIPLREMLRGIRFMVKQGGQTLKANASPRRLPKPAASLANTVIDELMCLGHLVNARASVLAKTVIGTEPDTDIMLDDIADRESAEALFAATAYAAMKVVLTRMKVSGVFVSEASAERAFVSERNERHKLSGFRLGASLTFRLIDGHFLREPFDNIGRLVPDSDVLPVAVFAVLLWLQSPRQEDDQEAALSSAVDLSVILASRIAAGCQARDIEAISALYRKYASNV